MTKELKWWESDAVKAIEVIAAIVGILSALGVLQYFGTIDLWTPISAFLATNILLILVLIIIILIVILTYILVRVKMHSNLIKKESHSECILDLKDAKRIAILCQTPRTTEFLRQQYDYWQSQSSVLVLGGYGFDNYMKDLEKQGFLEYNQNGTWKTTQTALAYITKYHGK
ncbi:MAG: hypothetical protein M1540_09195 [Candidatus Bathyarchaeota archaeon]|nr:hypothetical protein [Candidatus Bathyarchaeota archaeon]